MKTTITFAVIGLLLSLIAVGTSLEVCFHCIQTFKFDLTTILLTLLSSLFLCVALLRLIKTAMFIQLNSYNAESLVQFIPYESQPPFYLHLPVIYLYPPEMGY